jgi:hypothetical protein
MKRREEEIKQLQRTLRDLVALSTIPVTWINHDPRHLAEDAVDLLMSVLRPSLAYVHLQTASTNSALEAWRGVHAPKFLQSLQGSQPTRDSLNITDSVTNTSLHVVVFPLGLEAACGKLAVGSSRVDFPTQLESLLLSVVANQVFVIFQLLDAKTSLANAYTELRISQDKELKAAAHIQQGLMAGADPQLSFASVKARNLPCKEIGGDFFITAAMRGTLIVAIADISGKGASAAVMASVLQGLVQADLYAGLALTEIARGANSFLCSHHLEEMYATMVIACISPNGNMEYVNCGHVPPMISDFVGGIVKLTDHNVPVGLLPDAEFTDAGFCLKPGDRLILVTDGVTEAESPAGEFFGDQRLVESSKGKWPLENILTSIQSFCACRPASDDCTIVEVTYTGGHDFMPPLSPTGHSISITDDNSESSQSH